MDYVILGVFASFMLYKTYIGVRATWFPTLDDLKRERQSRLESERAREEFLRNIAAIDAEQDRHRRDREAWIDQCIAANAVVEPLVSRAD